MESEKYLPELMAEKDTLDPSFQHSFRLLEQGKGGAMVEITDFLKRIQNPKRLVLGLFVCLFCGWFFFFFDTLLVLCLGGYNSPPARLLEVRKARCADLFNCFLYGDT